LRAWLSAAGGAGPTLRFVPVISVITPVHSAVGQYLAQTGASVLGQVLPPGWELEWLVQEDGPDPHLGALLPPDARIRYDAHGRQFGCAVTRTSALRRARGELVFSLDGDDLLSPGAAGAYIRAAQANPGAAWFSGAYYRFGSSATPLHTGGLPLGQVPAGTVARYWEQAGRFPFPAAVVCYRAGVLLDRGGWPAVPRSDDAVLLAAVNATWPGMIIADEIFGYRQHAAQNTSQPWNVALKADVVAWALRWATRLAPPAGT